MPSHKAVERKKSEEPAIPKIDEAISPNAENADKNKKPP